MRGLQYTALCIIHYYGDVREILVVWWHNDESDNGFQCIQVINYVDRTGAM